MRIVIITCFLALAATGSRVEESAHFAITVTEQNVAKEESMATAANDLTDKFKAGSLIVHMKRNFSNPASTLKRWQSQGHLDDSLSFSMIHPQMALQKLWVKSGYIIDGSMCNTLAGSASDLWVNNEVKHNAHKILTTPEGKRAELLRMLFLRHAGVAKGHPIHTVLPPGPMRESFKHWVENPQSWSEYEKKVVTWPNPFDNEWTMKEVPGAEDLRDMIADLSRGDGPIKANNDFISLVDAVKTEYNMIPPQRKFNELLAQCPIQALRGYVYSIQDVPAEYIETFRDSKQKEGQKVLDIMRAQVPALSSQDLVIAEYSPSKESDMEHGILPESMAEILDMKSGSKTPVSVRWKTDFEAKLRILAVEGKV